MDNCTAFGFDPAFRHGALVQASFDIDQGVKDKLTDLKLTYIWTKRSEGIGERSEPQEVFHLVQQIIGSLRGQPVLPIAIDWDPNSVYWRSRKIQIVQLGLFIGYLTRAAHTLGFPVIYIRPADVRQSLGLRKAEKNALQTWFRESVDTSAFEHLFTTKNTDYLDATILAYLVARSVRRGGSYACHLLTSPD